jgi:hypothetical protein
LKPKWNTIAGRELYAHKGDDGTSFDEFENENLAQDPAYASLVQQLHSTLVNAFSNDG